MLVIKFWRVRNLPSASAYELKCMSPEIKSNQLLGFLGRTGRKEEKQTNFFYSEAIMVA